MLIKSADDKSKRLKLLEDLTQSDRLDARQRDWLREELMRLKRGIAGERDAAHYLDLSFSHSTNHAILHDLRLEADGQSAQIDHLVIARANLFYLLETKTYSGNLHINEHGEFSVEYGDDRRYGIESPLEQSRRHELVLKKVLKELGIKPRANMEPEFKHVVMVHPKAIIHRPPAKQFDSSMVIKADQFATWHEKYVNGLGLESAVSIFLQMRPRSTIQDWGNRLLSAHKPANQLALPEFMRPNNAPVVVDAPKPQAVEAPKSEVADAKGQPEICLTCGKVLTPKAAKFCRDQSKRFKGGLYCFNHQAAFK